MYKMIKNLIFDMGNVVLDYTPRRIASFFTSDPDELDFLCREVFSNKEWLSLDKGVMSEEQAIESIIARVPEKYHELCRKVMGGWEEFFLPVEGTYEQLLLLKERGYKLYMLTNASLKVYEYRKNSPAFDIMDGMFVSADVHLLKPDPAIYLRMLEKFGLEAEECLFFDDVEVNVEAARKLGIHGHVFRKEPDEIIKTVEEYENRTRNE